MLAVMLVAIQKDFWKADEKTQKELSEKFAKNIIEHGIPGSGHTHANHPIYDFVKEKIDKETASKLEEVLKESRIEKVKKEKNATSIQEIKMEEKESNTNNNESEVDGLRKLFFDENFRKKPQKPTYWAMISWNV